MSDEEMMGNVQDDKIDEVQTAVEQTVNEESKSEDVVKKQKTEAVEKPRKKKNGFVKFLKGLLIFIAVILLVVLGWVLYSKFAGDSIESYVEPEYTTYINVPSVSNLIDEALYLSAVDALFADPAFVDIKNIVLSLRTNEMLKTWWFRFATNFRLDTAVYTDTDNAHIRLIGDLGIRSAVTRLTPMLLKLMPGALDDVEGLTVESDEVGQYFVYSLSDSQKIYIRLYKNLVIADIGTSYEVFAKAINKVDGKYSRALKKDLKQIDKKTINILADANFAKQIAPQDNQILKKLLPKLEFKKYSAVNLAMTDNNISVNGKATWLSDDVNIQAILRNRGSVPTILSSLPNNTEYLTLLNINSLSELWTNLQPFLDAETKNMYNTADRMASMILNVSINELLFSWSGREMGLFALANIKDPVFFVSINDKKACNFIFEEIFNSFFLDRDSSAVVDDIRISRIVTPSWMTGLLRLFKIELPKPFYFIDGDFIFFSNSSEAIATYKQAKDHGNIITKNHHWKEAIKNISTETSILMYYNLNRSIPFFLETQSVAKSVIEKYQRGLFSLKFDSKDTINVDFYAMKTEEKALKTISGFPHSVDTKVFGEIHCANNNAGTPYAFWSDGKTVYSLELTTGNVKKLSVDADTNIVLQKLNDKLIAVWGLSKNGTIYKMNESLDALGNFPVLTSIKAIGEPVVLDNGIVFSTQNEENLILVDSTGTVNRSAQLNGKMKNSPVVVGDKILALPRSFESTVYILNNKGEINSGTPPFELDEISAVQPIMFKNTQNKYVIMNITESGIFTIHYLEGSGEERLIVKTELDGAYRIQPVYSKTLNSILLISDTGLLKIVNLNGNVTNATTVKNGKADNYTITLYDLNHNGTEEIFISGGGNAIYGYNINLEELEEFPIQGAGEPQFIDISGDGIPDILTYGIDKKIHSFLGGK